MMAVLLANGAVELRLSIGRSIAVCAVRSRPRGGAISHDVHRVIQPCQYNANVYGETRYRYLRHLSTCLSIPH